MIYEVHQWIASVANQCAPPYLEVGSRWVQEGMDLREIFAGPYVGLDMQDGPGVDVVADFEGGGIRAGSFRTVICADTLEHMRHPQRAVENMYDVLAPGGTCVVSVPFAWYLHDHPRDYWRMSADALEDTLEGVGFAEVLAGFGGTELTMEWHQPFGDKPHRDNVWSHALALARKGDGRSNGHKEEARRNGRAVQKAARNGTLAEGKKGRSKVARSKKAVR